MDIRRGAVSTLSAVALVMSAGCMPSQEGAAAPGGGASLEVKAGAAGGASGGAAQEQKKESAAPPVPSEEQCRAPASKPVSVPASAGEPKAQYDAFFDAHHETFRCCFDAVYAPQKPLKDGTVALIVRVDKTGKLTGSEVVAGETNATDPKLNTCMLDVAKMMAFPAPANKKPLGYKRVFNFKARR